MKQICRILLITFFIAFCVLFSACEKQASSDYTTEIDIIENDDSTVVFGKIEPNVYFDYLPLPTTKSVYKSFVAKARKFDSETLATFLLAENIKVTTQEKNSDEIIDHTVSDLGTGLLICVQGHVTYVVDSYQSLVSQLPSLKPNATELEKTASGSEFENRFISLLDNMQIEIGAINITHLEKVPFISEDETENNVDCLSIEAVYQMDAVDIQNTVRFIENGYDSYLQSAISALYVNDQLAWLDISGIYEPIEAEELTIIPFSTAALEVAGRLNKLEQQNPIEIQDIQFCYLPHAIAKNDPLLVKLSPTWCFRVGSELWIYIDAISGQEVL